MSEGAATVALVARVDLAAAFALSAGAKLADLPATAAGLAAFGAPAPHLVARVLPAVEAALAVALLAVPDHPGPGLAALLTVAAFTAMVGMRLARGQAVPCPCFGARGVRPVSAASLVRNVALLTLAAAATLPAGDASPGAAAAVLAVVLPVTVVALRRTA
ncbi:MAG: MauE/DoxX family redox-associated membrane protein [Acidimicrobiia bacterium]